MSPFRYTSVVVSDLVTSGSVSNDPVVFDPSAFLSQKEPRKPPSCRDVCRTEVCRPEVLTLYYINTTKFSGSNTMEQSRRDPLPMGVVEETTHNKKNIINYQLLRLFNNSSPQYNLKFQVRRKRYTTPRRPSFSMLNLSRKERRKWDVINPHFDSTFGSHVNHWWVEMST